MSLATPAAAAPQAKAATFSLKIPSDAWPLIALLSATLMMVVPVPPAFLDLLLVLNITLSLTILVVTMHAKTALEFSVFPSLLLMVTLLRLSLNISSTRLILTQGYAGDVIEAFGTFVVGANYVVGFVMFAILAVIQFVVITHGAQRVAEVTARFTLDALPGKQMAIDSELSAGLLSDVQARERRALVQREADFYGSMDGASKFIRGDAIAAVIVLIVNIVGGLLIGIVQLGMPLGEAVQRYTLLTVGEGLVGQLPALLVSTATGLMVTRTASSGFLGADVMTQMTLEPKSMQGVAGLIGGLALVPGVPKLPLLLIAAGMYFISVRVQKGLVEKARTATAQAPPAPVSKEPEDVTNLLELEPMELEIGYSLVPLVDAARSNDLLSRVVSVRRSCAMELGLVVPPIRIHDSYDLRPNEYAVKIYGTIVASGEVMMGRYMALNYGDAEDEIDGLETKEPAFNIPALWIPESQKEEAEALGCTVIDPASVIATHLSEVLRGRAGELLGRQEVQTLVDRVKQKTPALVEDLIPTRLSLGEVHRVMANLLKERVSIRNLRLILETLADWAPSTRDPLALTEHVRVALGRSICGKHRQKDNVLYCLTLDAQVEAMLKAAAPGATQPRPLDPARLREVYAQLTRALGTLTSQGYPGVVLCSPEARPVFRHMVERVAPGLVVLSYREIPPDQSVTAVDTVSQTAPVA